MSLEAIRPVMNEYRITADPARSSLLANAIAHGIFEDGKFDPAEAIEAKRFIQSFKEKEKARRLEYAIYDVVSETVREKFFKAIRVDIQSHRYPPEKYKGEHDLITGEFGVYILRRLASSGREVFPNRPFKSSETSIQADGGEYDYTADLASRRELCFPQIDFRLYWGWPEDPPVVNFNFGSACIYTHELRQELAQK